MVAKEFDWGLEKPLACPQCGFEYVHIIKLKCLRGNDETLVTSERICVHEAKGEGRGVKITLEYACENGHHGNIVFHFHEGMTYYKNEKLANIEDWKDIWRD